MGVNITPIMNFAVIIIQVLFVPLVAPLIIGVTRRIKAAMQNRRGADIFQPYRDLIKLFRKAEVLSEDATTISLVSPYVVFASMITIGALIPIVPFAGNILSSYADFIVVISLMILATFFLALNGLDAGNAFGGLGSSREMTLAALTEAGLFFSFMSIALLVQSTNLITLSIHIGTLPSSDWLILSLAFLAFFIALLAENARYPFDNPSTHLELTMVHEAMIIEASGPRLALFEWAAASKLLIFIVLGANIFIPWGIIISGWQSLSLAILVLLCKVFVLTVAVAMLESMTAKLRFFRLPDLLSTSFMLGLIALALAIF
ncbi:MAG: hypothetical protein UY04_C0025G0019 [Parcubacteria group bacterium GW2011_GWA2_47_7]|nr:MAG: hypothetical protein UY04_C0025G0019 [Parcubacteria group bacterium GW2011_GWA2_47_7]